MTSVHLGVALLLAAVAWPAAGQWSGWDYDRDELKKERVEREVKPPAYPKEGSLLQFDAGAATRHRFFIDPESISVGDDGIVRYTLVVKTAGGSSNVSFEGMRCDSRELKVYAFGRTDGSWIPARDPQWRRIEYQEVNRHHGVLHRDYFCAGKSSKQPVTSAKEAIRLLRYGPPRDD